MDNCPLCGANACVQQPEWSGGRYSISCTQCGKFSTNKITIDELQSLKQAGSDRIEEIRYSIATAEEPWYITRSPRHGIIVLESEKPSPALTKKQKKHRRRTETAPSIHQAGKIDKVDKDQDNL